MTREEAIKDLQENGVDLGAGDFVDVESLHMAISALREQPRWISVEERLPLDGLHLTFGPQRAHEVLYFDSYDKEWSDIDDNEIEVTHWMPLPEPPEVEV